jgi:IMP dehydrogenase
MAFPACWWYNFMNYGGQMINPDKVEFFEDLDQQGLAVTYNDLRVRTAQSDVSPSEVNLASPFSRNLELKVPMVSAAMDTVTEADMAIAMAKLGGLGIIHAGLELDDQANEVRRVKYHLSGRIDKPISYDVSQSMSSVLEECDRRSFDFRTFPVVDEEQRLVGLLTQGDFDFCENFSEPVSEHMTPLAEVTYEEGDITVEAAYDIMKAHKRKTLPLVDVDQRVSGLYVLSDVLRIVRGNPDNYNLDAAGRLVVGAAVPTDPEEAIERVRAMEGYLDVAVIDTAQGDSKYSFATLKALKEATNIDVVVGNVSEGASAAALAEAGADGIKVGQGGGAICTTRSETGIGTPQVTAVYESAKAISKLSEDYQVPVCADGGLKDPGDIPIAIAGGAHTVMMGNMLSATDEAPGEVIVLENGTRVMLYRGMGSPSALRDNAASRKRYGVEGTPGKPLAEGVESYKPYKGSVFEVMDRYIKALRKGMSYVGSPDIQAQREKTRFRRITNAGLQESHPHDVQVITGS